MQEVKKSFFDKVKNLERANFYDYLSVMIDWWVWISEALDTLDKKIKNKYFLSKIYELRDLINSWDKLSKAMKKIPDTFDDAEIAIIEAWENAGKLSQSLSTLSEKLKDKDDLKKKVKWSLTYPVIIVFFLVLAVTTVMIVVIPGLMPIFKESNIELPLATKALVATSDFFKSNIITLVFLVIASILFLAWYKKTESGRAFFDNLALELPLVWDITRNYILANISTNLWTLIAGWIPIMKAMSLTWRATNNVIYAEAFEDIKDRLSKWSKIVESMVDVDDQGKLFTADFLQMLSVWEKTASMEKVCTKINKQYNREVQASLNSLTKWVEPIAIAIAWAFVLWFAFAVFGAILEVTKNV